MKIISNITDFRLEGPTVVSIGKFDGNHLGHLQVIECMKKIAKEHSLMTAIFSFYTSPADVIEKDGKRHLQISTSEERREKLSDEGIDYLIEYPFNDEISRISGTEFVETILIKKMNMKAIVGGNDLSFGHRKSGNVALLKELAVRDGFQVYIIEKVKETSGEDISSTMVKTLLSTGDVEKVAGLLGQPYSIVGTVEEGNHIGGRFLGHPTANIYPDSCKFIPKVGVYVTFLTDENGNRYLSMTNVGTNPSIEDDGLKHRIRIETNVLDYQGNLYGKEVTIEFIRYLRDEMKFESLEQLHKQLESDEIEARRTLNER